MNLLFILLFIFSNPSDTTYLLDGQVKIVDSWMRVGAQGKATGVFFKIENKSDIADTLYRASSNISKKTEIHETYNAGDDMMGMREVKEIIIPAKSYFELKPGSFHIMLIGLNQDVKINDEAEISLFFRNAGEIKIKPRAMEMKMKNKMHNH